MNLSRCHAIVGLAAFLAAAPAAQAQQLTPRVAYVYPAGGRQGTSLEVVVAGQFLNDAANAYVSGAGVQASVIKYDRPMTVEEAGLLRIKLDELENKRAASQGRRNPDQQDTPQPSARPVWTAEDEKKVAEIREKFSTFIPKNQVNPAITETVTLQVTIAPDAQPGPRALRLRTPLGMTNPRVFCVGQLPEFGRTPAKRYREPKDGKGPKIPPAAPEMPVTLPAALNGQIMPGAADRFRFPARKAQRLIITASARELIPYLPDAVPGWFQASLTLYDAKGKELAYADRNLFRADPALYYEVPEDGDYVLEIKDSIYRGREDFVYRITVGEMPLITSIFPLGGPAGAQTPVELKGWNLPVTRLTMDAKDEGPGIHPLSVRKDQWGSNRMPFAVDTLPECLEREPNDQPASAQPTTLPVIVNGRIDKPDDWDVFCFEGRGGDEIVAEVYARRLNSPLDSVLKLTDAGGKQLAFNDDHEDKGSGLNTHHADSLLRATLPAGGTYYLQLGDAQHQGGPAYAYRLRVSPPRPDFELRVVPSSISARGGTTVPITVYALRKDGFSDEIVLALKDAPAGFALSGGRVPASQDQVRLTLTVPPAPLREPLSLSMEGSASVQGRQVSHPAIPAEDMMQAFAYHHLVPVQDVKVVVMRRNMARGPAKILGASPVKIPAGGTAQVRFDISSSALTDKAELELIEPPDGITIRSVSPSRDGLEIVLQSDAAKARPGLRGNLIVMAYPEGSLASAKANARGTIRRIPLDTLPAIPFEIVAP